MTFQPCWWERLHRKLPFCGGSLFYLRRAAALYKADVVREQHYETSIKRRTELQQYADGFLAGRRFEHARLSGTAPKGSPAWYGLSHSLARFRPVEFEAVINASIEAAAFRDRNDLAQLKQIQEEVNQMVATMTQKTKKTKKKKTKRGG